jgi:hypothetical protein
MKILLKKKGGGSVSLDLAHAQRVLRLEAFKGWKEHTIDKESKYEFVNNEIRVKSDKGTSKKSTKQKSDRASDKA